MYFLYKISILCKLFHAISLCNFYFLLMQHDIDTIAPLVIWLQELHWMNRVLSKQKSKRVVWKLEKIIGGIEVSLRRFYNASRYLCCLGVSLSSFIVIRVDYLAV